MKTLWTFGDSFTFGWGLVEHKWHTEAAKRYFDEYVDSSKDKPWPNLLADKLNVKLENHAENGLSNYDIIDRIIEQSPNIKKGDYVVVCKSFSGRMRFPINETEWELFTAGEVLQTLEDKLDSHLIDLVGMEKFKNHLIYTLQEINQISGSHITSINELRPKDGIETVTNHTNWDIQDYHPSVNGHRAIAKLIHSNLMNDKREFLI
jgi:lysophospholipase L1-like esterase